MNGGSPWLEPGCSAVEHRPIGHESGDLLLSGDPTAGPSGAGSDANGAVGRTMSFCVSEAALETLDAVALARAARVGDELALSIFATTGRYLGQAIAVLADVIDPEVVVGGGVHGRCLDLLEADTIPAFEAEMQGGAVRSCPILPAGLGEAVGDYSASAVALTDSR